MLLNYSNTLKILFISITLPYNSLYSWLFEMYRKKKTLNSSILSSISVAFGFSKFFSLVFIFKKYFIYLFMSDTEEKEREKGRDTGRGRSRLHVGSLMWERGTLFRDSRIAHWAAGGAKLLHHGGCLFLGIFNSWTRLWHFIYFLWIYFRSLIVSFEHHFIYTLSIPGDK